MIQADRFFSKCCLTMLFMSFLLLVENLSSCPIKLKNGFKNTYYDVLDVDSLPTLKYKTISRSIQPFNHSNNNNPKHTKDSLLSVFIEENICCPIPCEGRFIYTLELKISNKGIIEKVTFIEDDNNSEMLRDQIFKVLCLIKYTPAIKGTKTVGVCVRVKLFIDLYNYPSKINKQLFNLLGDTT